MQEALVKVYGRRRAGEAYATNVVRTVFTEHSFGSVWLVPAYHFRKKYWFPPTPGKLEGRSLFASKQDEKLSGDSWIVSNYEANVIEFGGRLPKSAFYIIILQCFCYCPRYGRKSASGRILWPSNFTLAIWQSMSAFFSSAKIIYLSNPSWTENKRITLILVEIVSGYFTSSWITDIWSTEHDLFTVQCAVYGKPKSFRKCFIFLRYLEEKYAASQMLSLWSFDKWSATRLS